MLKKYLFSLFSLKESLKNSSYWPSFFHRKFIAFIAMILKFPSLHRSEKKVQWISQYTPHHHFSTSKKMHGCQRNMSLELDLNSQLYLSMPNVIAIKLNISSWCFYIVQQYHSFLNTETLLHCCKSWNNSTVWSKGVLTQSFPR